jgi:hypothetical protein
MKDKKNRWHVGRAGCYKLGNNKAKAVTAAGTGQGS